jgi:hypothetical protein
MSGPILKDATYFGFWAGALLLGLLAQVAEIALLWAILREVRR